MEKSDVELILFLIIFIPTSITTIYFIYLLILSYIEDSGCRDTFDYNNKYHSLNDKPARIYNGYMGNYGVSCTIKEWYNHGVLHNTSGPAKTVNYNIFRPYLPPKTKDKYFYIDGKSILTSGKIKIEDLPIGSRFTTFNKDDLYEKVKENKDGISCEALKNGTTYSRFNYKNPDGTDKLVIF